MSSKASSVGQRRASSERSVSPTNSDKSDVVAGRTRSRRSLISLEVITEIQTPEKKLETPRGRKSRRTSTLESTSSLQSINENETSENVVEKKDKKQATDTKGINLDKVYEILNNFDGKQDAEENVNNKIGEVLNVDADVAVSHSIKAVELVKCLEKSADPISDDSKTTDIELKADISKSISSDSPLVKLSSNNEPRTSVDKMSEGVEDTEQKNIEKLEREKLLSNLGLNKGEKFYKETKVHIHRMENIFPAKTSSSATGKLDVALSNSNTSPEKAINTKMHQNENEDQISLRSLEHKIIDKITGSENSNNIADEAAATSEVGENVTLYDESKGNQSVSDIKLVDNLHVSKVPNETSKLEDAQIEDASHINAENAAIKESNDGNKPGDRDPEDHEKANSSRVEKVKHLNDENDVTDDNADAIGSTPKLSKHVEDATGLAHERDGLELNNKLPEESKHVEDATGLTHERDGLELNNKLPEESAAPENVIGQKSSETEISLTEAEEINLSDAEKMQHSITQNNIEETVVETVDRKLSSADLGGIVGEKADKEVEADVVCPEAHQSSTEKCTDINEAERKNNQEVTIGDIDGAREEEDGDRGNVREKDVSLNVTTQSGGPEEMNVNESMNVDDVSLVENKVSVKEKSFAEESSDVTVQNVSVENQSSIEASVKDSTMECDLAVPPESQRKESNDEDSVEQLSFSVVKDSSSSISKGQVTASRISENVLDIELQEGNAVCSVEIPNTFEEQQLANMSVTNVETDKSVDENHALDTSELTEDENVHVKNVENGAHDENVTAQHSFTEDKDVGKEKGCDVEIARGDEDIASVENKRQTGAGNVQELEILSRDEPGIEDDVTKNVDEDVDKEDELEKKSKTANKRKQNESLSGKENIDTNTKSYEPLRNDDSDIDSMEDESVSDGTYKIRVYLSFFFTVT